MCNKYDYDNNNSYEQDPVKIDIKKAFKYYNMAADKDHIDALLRIGDEYYIGTRIKKDFKNG